MPRKNEIHLHKATWYIKPGQKLFLERKVRELQQRVPTGSEAVVSESALLQALISMWMANEGQEILE